MHKIGFIQIFSVCNLCRYTKYLLSPINLALFVVNFISNVILVTVLIEFYVDHLTPRSKFPRAWLFVQSELNNICSKSLVHFFDVVVHCCSFMNYIWELGSILKQNKNQCLITFLERVKEFFTFSLFLLLVSHKVVGLAGLAEDGQGHASPLRSQFQKE